MSKCNKEYYFAWVGSSLCSEGRSRGARDIKNRSTSNLRLQDPETRNFTNYKKYLKDRGSGKEKMQPIDLPDIEGLQVPSYVRQIASGKINRPKTAKSTPTVEQITKELVSLTKIY